MSKNINVPKLRFKEFSEEWEEKELEKIFNIFQGFAFSSSDITNEGVRWLKIADVGIQRMKYDTPCFLPKIFKEKYSKFLLNKNDYVLALTRPILNGMLKIAKIDDIYNGSLLNQRVGKIITRESLDFIYYFLQQTNLINKIDSFILGSEPPNLSINQIKFIKASIPLKKEQEKIASFLTSVDTKIEQLIKKDEFLQQYKKGMIQKIFNEEIRFKADDGNEFSEWEEKKLSDILDYIQPTKYLVKDTEYNNSFKIPVLTAGKTFILGYTDETDGIYKDNLPVIIFDDFTTANRFVNFQFKVKSSAIKILVPKENNNIKFIYEAMQMIKYEVGGHERHWISKFSFLDIFVPCVEEQNKIANFLSSIDDKIEKNQKILEKTKKFKKSLLQQMFV